jgi:hypothetical protein
MVNAIDLAIQLNSLGDSQLIEIAFNLKLFLT